MVKEIMPFSEDLTAAIVSTKEHSDYPSRVATFVFENHVLFGIRHMFHYSNVLQFKRLVIKYENMLIFLNCFIVFEVTHEVKVVPLKDFFRTVICLGLSLLILTLRILLFRFSLHQKNKF